MFAGRFTDDRGWLRSGRCPDTPAGKFVAAAGDTDQLLTVGVSVGSDAMLPAGPG
jgi:hypothetical protein